MLQKSINHLLVLVVKMAGLTLIFMELRGIIDKLIGGVGLKKREERSQCDLKLVIV